MPGACLQYWIAPDAKVKLTEQQKTALMGLLDWYFASLEVDTGAKRSRRNAETFPENAARDNANDSTGDSDAPLQAERDRIARRLTDAKLDELADGLQHTDASASGSVPADFVPTSAMNNRPTANGSKTDAAMVRRI
jgi:hypothetical protein